MRTALYMETGLMQVVLTPETADEKAILSTIEAGAKGGALSVLRGEFYACAGGWTREREGSQSLLLVVRKP